MAHVVMPVCLLTQDCNLVAYSGLSNKNGFNQATAVYYSNTFLDAGFGPCALNVSSAEGGSIYINATQGGIIYQQPAPAVTPGALYTFNGITFSSCGIYGQTGPIRANCFYTQYGAWTGNTAFLSVVAGIQSWTVPATGVYRYHLHARVLLKASVGVW